MRACWSLAWRLASVVPTGPAGRLPAISRACALGCLAASVAVARPAAASMTIGLRDQLGHTRTFYQDGSRIRIANPSGSDEGEARLMLPPQDRLTRGAMEA